MARLDLIDKPDCRQYTLDDESKQEGGREPNCGSVDACQPHEGQREGETIFVNGRDEKICRFFDYLDVLF